MSPPTRQIIHIYFMVYVCYAGVISKVSLNCSNGNFREWENTCSPKKVSVSQKMPRQKCQISLHFNIIFNNVEHIILKMNYAIFCLNGFS